MPDTDGRRLNSLAYLAAHHRPRRGGARNSRRLIAEGTATRMSLQPRGSVRADRAGGPGAAGLSARSAESAG
jgi:hypothetical protein